MLFRHISRSIRTSGFQSSRIFTKPSTYRTFTSTTAIMGKDSSMSDQPPAHEMKVFNNLGATNSGKFRKVLHTGLYSQLVEMSIPVGGDIGDEVHTVDQILTFTSGQGKATVNGKNQDFVAPCTIVVPAGTQHQFVNTGNTPMNLFTVYSPAEHDPRTVHETKEEGDKEEDEGKDEAPAWSRKSKKENEDAGLVKLSGKYD
jgi:mannose-6-phosphate isomerase-like protein (cupin superfamily)